MEDSRRIVMMRTCKPVSCEGAGVMSILPARSPCHSDSNASIDGRAVTAEYDLRKHVAKPVSPKAVRRGLTQSRNSAPPRSVFGDTSHSEVINHLISRPCRRGEAVAAHRWVCRTLRKRESRYPAILSDWAFKDMSRSFDAFPYLCD